MNKSSPVAVKLAWLRDDQPESQYVEAAEVPLEYDRDDDGVTAGVQNFAYLEGIPHDPTEETIDIIPIPISPISKRPVVKHIKTHLTTTLNTGVTDVDATSFVVDEPTGANDFQDGNILLIGSEKCKIVSISTAGGGTDTWTVKRARYGTTAATHSAAATITLIQWSIGGVASIALSGLSATPDAPTSFSVTDPGEDLGNGGFFQLVRPDANSEQLWAWEVQGDNNLFPETAEYTANLNGIQVGGLGGSETTGRITPGGSVLVDSSQTWTLNVYANKILYTYESLDETTGKVGFPHGYKIASNTTDGKVTITESTPGFPNHSDNSAVKYIIADGWASVPTEFTVWADALPLQSGRQGPYAGTSEDSATLFFSTPSFLRARYKGASGYGQWIYYNGSTGTTTRASATAYSPVPIGVGTLPSSVLQWHYDGTFSSTDADTVSWTAGNFTDGTTTYSIGLGNTGNMAALTYVYLDEDVSTTAFQTTTTLATAVGPNKVIVGTAQNGATDATWNPGLTGFPFISENEIRVPNLSAISVDAGTLTAGTITGLTVQTAASGARVLMDSAGLKTYDAANNLLAHIQTSGGQAGQLSLASSDTVPGGLIFGIASPFAHLQALGSSVVNFSPIATGVGDLRLGATSKLWNQVSAEAEDVFIQAQGTPGDILIDASTGLLSLDSSGSIRAFQAIQFDNAEGVEFKASVSLLAGSISANSSDNLVISFNEKNASDTCLIYNAGAGSIVATFDEAAITLHKFSDFQLGAEVSGVTGTILTLNDSSGTGSPGLVFEQNTALASTISHIDSGDMLRLNSNAGGIELYTANTLRMTISSAGVANIANLTASKLMASDGSKNLVSSDLFAWVSATLPLTVADDTDGTITIAAPTAVVGPGSNTLNALAVYDGATGKLLKDAPYLLHAGSFLQIGEATGELLRLNDNSSTGNPKLVLAQLGTPRSYIQHVDSGDVLKIASEFGSVSIFTGTGGTEVGRLNVASGGLVTIHGTNAELLRLDTTGEGDPGLHFYQNGTLRAEIFYDDLTASLDQFTIRVNQANATAGLRLEASYGPITLNPGASGTSVMALRATGGGDIEVQQSLKVDTITEVTTNNRVQFTDAVGIRIQDVILRPDSSSNDALNILPATSGFAGALHLDDNGTAGALKFLISMAATFDFSANTSNNIIDCAGGQTLVFQVSGATKQTFYSTGGVAIGAPGGGDKGAGTLNVDNGIYDDGSINTDFVFGPKYNLLTIDEVAGFFKANNHLPWIPGRAEWEAKGKPSLGEISNYLTETSENQQLYITGLHERTNTLEKQVEELKTWRKCSSKWGRG